MAAALIELATEQLTTNTNNTGTSAVAPSTVTAADDTTVTPKVTSPTPEPSRRGGRAA